MKTMLMLAATLAPQPSIYVSTPGQSQSPAQVAMRNELIVRLLEEGYPVAARRQSARVELVVSSTTAGWSVTALGKTQRRFAVAPGGVAELEVLQRAIDAIEEAGPRDAAQVRPPKERVAIHLDSTVPASTREMLEGPLALAILSSGATLAPAGTDHQRVVCIAGNPTAVSISIGLDADNCPSYADAPPPPTSVVPVGEISSRTKALLQDPVVAQRPNTLVEQPPAPASPPQSPAPAVSNVDERLQPPQPSTSDTRRRPKANEQPPRRARRPARKPRRRTRAKKNTVVRAGARGGLVARLTDVDGVVGASVRFGREPGLGLLLDTQLWPSSAGPLSVFEAVPAVGAGWRFAVRKFRFDLNALVGLQIHRYTFNSDPAAHEFDWSVEAVAGVSYVIVRGLEAKVGLRAGRSGRERSHITFDGSTEYWTRSAWRIGLTIGLNYGWKIR